MVPRQATCPSTNPSCDDTKVTDIGAKPPGTAAAPIGSGPPFTGLAVTDAAADGAGALDDVGALAERMGVTGAELAAADGGADDCDGVAGPELAPALPLEWLLEQLLAKTTVARARAAAGVVQIRVM
jgi:hypothetical protein